MVDRTDSLSVLRAVARDFQPLSGPYKLTFETHAGLQRSGATWGSVQAPCAHVLMLALCTQCFLLVVARYDGALARALQRVLLLWRRQQLRSEAPFASQLAPRPR